MGKFFEKELQKMKEMAKWYEDVFKAEGLDDEVKKTLQHMSKSENYAELNKQFDAEFHKAVVGRKVTLMGRGTDTTPGDRVEGTIVGVYPDLQMFEIIPELHNGRKVEKKVYMRIFAELFDVGFDVLLYD